MRSNRTAGALALALSLCAPAAFAAGAPQNVAQIAPAHALSAETMPDVVAGYARAYAATAPTLLDNERGRLEEIYAHEFFQGYVNPDGAMSSVSTLARDAYARGQAYRREHPGQQDAILAGYGYEPVETDGTWLEGFEISILQPQDRSRGWWWLSSIGNVPWPDRERVQQTPNGGGMHVHIIGYLSPPGHYGHMGQSKRQVLVTSISLIDAATP